MSSLSSTGRANALQSAMKTNKKTTKHVSFNLPNVAADQRTNPPKPSMQTTKHVSFEDDVEVVEQSQQKSGIKKCFSKIMSCVVDVFNAIGAFFKALYCYCRGSKALKIEAVDEPKNRFNPDYITTSIIEPTNCVEVDLDEVISS